MTLTIASVNLNGIRAATRKGFMDWLKANPVDIVCIQETKAQVNDMEATHLCPEGYHCYFNDAEKKGYSGVAIFSKVEPDTVTTGLGIEWADQEGRYIQANYGDLTVASLYLPSGSSGDHRQDLKFDFMDKYTEQLEEIAKQTERSYVICGDWNIVHTKKDIKNWSSNQKSSGCLPEERAWLDKLFNELGLIDAFRVVNQEEDQYTWWSYRANAWANNVGWRIDYQIITPDLREKVVSTKIHRDQRFSDHAPLVLEYNLDLK